MARINSSVFAGRKGATIKCSKCGRNIEKGERYRWFKLGFRSRYKTIICATCPVKPSETMTSKMRAVVEAGETANSLLDDLEATDPGEIGDIQAVVSDAASSIEQVADEYQEAAEASPTGMIFGEDYTERADEIRDAASTLEQWSADEDEPTYDHDSHGDPDDPERVEDGTPDNCEECAEEQQTWWTDQIQSARDAIEEATNI